MNHAQARFYRRIQNKCRWGVSTYKGEPIAGELTQKEIAHKARRRERRKHKHKEMVQILAVRIQEIESLIKRISNAEMQEEVRKNAVKVEEMLLSSYKKQFAKSALSLQRLI